MLILANPSTSLSTSASPVITRGSDIAEFSLPVIGYVVSGTKTVQVEVKE
jgi:hypothetical protein